MEAIKEAIEVLNKSIIKITFNDTFKNTYHDNKDRFFSELYKAGEGGTLYALYSFESTFKAGIEDVQGIVVIAPPIIPYECRRMRQTVEVPREYYLSNKEYAAYLKAEYGIESIPLSEYDGTQKKFVTISNSVLSVRIKGAVISAYRRFEDDVNRRGIEHARKNGLHIYDWERDLYPAAFGTLQGPEWILDETKPTAEPVNYSKIKKRDKTTAKKTAIAVMNNLAKTQRAAYTVKGKDGRNIYGTGIEFKIHNSEQTKTIQTRLPNP